MNVYEKTKNNLINVINNLIEKKLDQNNILQNVINNINNNFDIFTDNNKLIEEKIKFIIIFISFFEKYPFLSDCFENNIFSSHIYQYFIKIYLDLNIENEEYLNSLFSLLLLFTIALFDFLLWKRFFELNCDDDILLFKWGIRFDFILL